MNFPKTLKTILRTNGLRGLTHFSPVRRIQGYILIMIPTWSGSHFMMRSINRFRISK